MIFSPVKLLFGDLSGKGTPRCLKYFFNHSNVRFTATPKLALPAQTLDLRPFHFTKNDGFVKSPTSALRCILRHCSVL
jgi:hypothetical protein